MIAISRFIRLPLLFLFLASLMGVFLRWQFISPTEGTHYAFFLHGHSHIMFLGWVFNVLYLAFAINFINTKEQRGFVILFIVLQVLTAGMLISFPLQGYGFYSILLSTMHTVGSVGFSVLFIRRTKTLTTLSVWFARAAVIFFLISTVGPFSLGNIMAKGLGQSHWYYFSVYYYLHFQYNGFFLFGILSLFFHRLENSGIEINTKYASEFGRWMAIACIPAYFLSTLWSGPPFIFYILSGIAATLQVYAMWLLLKWIGLNLNLLKRIFHKSMHIFLLITLLAFTVKIVLQMLSVHPYMAQLAFQLRPVVIAYLHLVLLGIITLFLLVWYVEHGFIGGTSARRILAIFVIAFVGMEATLTATPWWNQISNVVMMPSAHYVFFFSVILSLCCLLFYLLSVKQGE